MAGTATIAELHRTRDDLSLVCRENIADPVGLSAESCCEAGDHIAAALLLALAAHEPAW